MKQKSSIREIFFVPSGLKIPVQCFCMLNPEVYTAPALMSSNLLLENSSPSSQHLEKMLVLFVLFVLAEQVWEMDLSGHHSTIFSELHCSQHNTAFSPAFCLFWFFILRMETACT